MAQGAVTETLTCHNPLRTQRYDPTLAWEICKNTKTKYGAWYLSNLFETRAMHFRLPEPDLLILWRVITMSKSGAKDPAACTKPNEKFLLKPTPRLTTPEESTCTKSEQHVNGQLSFVNHQNLHICATVLVFASFKSK